MNHEVGLIGQSTDTCSCHGCKTCKSIINQGHLLLSVFFFFYVSFGVSVWVGGKVSPVMTCAGPHLWPDNLQAPEAAVSDRK